MMEELWCVLSLVCVCVFGSSKAGISEMFEGHHGPITGIHCHTAAGAVDFSHLFLTSSFDWTVKLWSTKVPQLTITLTWKQIVDSISSITLLFS